MTVPANVTFPDVSTLPLETTITGSYEVVLQRPGQAKPSRISLNTLVGQALQRTDFQPRADDRWLRSGKTTFRTDSKPEFVVSATAANPTFVSDIPTSGFLWLRNALLTSDDVEASATSALPTSYTTGTKLYLLSDTPYMNNGYVEFTLADAGTAGGSGAEAYTRFQYTATTTGSPKANVNDFYKLSTIEPLDISIESAWLDDTSEAVRGTPTTPITDSANVPIVEDIDLRNASIRRILTAISSAYRKLSGAYEWRGTVTVTAKGHVGLPDTNQISVYPNDDDASAATALIVAGQLLQVWKDANNWLRGEVTAVTDNSGILAVDVDWIESAGTLAVGDAVEVRFPVNSLEPRVPVLAAAPSNAFTGQHYFDTVKKRTGIYDGTDWQYGAYWSENIELNQWQFKRVGTDYSNITTNQRIFDTSPGVPTPKRPRGQTWHYNETEGLGRWMILPSNLDQFSKLRVTAIIKVDDDADTGDVKLFARYLAPALDAGYNIDYTDTDWTTIEDETINVPASVTKDISYRSEFETSTLPEAGREMCLLVGRLGKDAADTYPNSVYLTTCLIELVG